MDPQRLQYLRALGIDVWERRQQAAILMPPINVETNTATHIAPLMSPSKVTGLKKSKVTDTKSHPKVHRGSKSGDGGDDDSNATDSAIAALNWSELEQAVEVCTRCDLHLTRTQTVFGVGNRKAEWMVVGEAPGADEDAQGEPFVGRAGQLLNSMVKAVGLKREQVFIANVLKSRPPNNRDPTPSEVTACIPFLHRQIELVNPRIILCVGRIAAQNLLNTTTPIGKLRGQVHKLGAKQRPVVVTYHPAYLLRSPGEKRRAWQDLILAMHTYEQVSKA